MCLLQQACICKVEIVTTANCTTLPTAGIFQCDFIQETHYCGKIIGLRRWSGAVTWDDLSGIDATFQGIQVPIHPDLNATQFLNQDSFFQSLSSPGAQWAAYTTDNQIIVPDGASSQFRVRAAFPVDSGIKHVYVALTTDPSHFSPLFLARFDVNTTTRAVDVVVLRNDSMDPAAVPVLTWQGIVLLVAAIAFAGIFTMQRQ